MTIQTQSDARDFTGIIHIPLETNPLSLNEKRHWAKEAKLKKQWRMFAGFNAARYPVMGRCDVTLTWFWVIERKRDEDNMALLLKSLCDGVVDAGIVADDTPDLMSKRCRIERAPAGSPMAYMELKIETRKESS